MNHSISLFEVTDEVHFWTYQQALLKGYGSSKLVSYDYLAVILVLTDFLTWALFLDDWEAEEGQAAKAPQKGRRGIQYSWKESRCK